MSDLHCAATLLVATLADRDHEQVRALARSLVTRRVARVYADTLEQSVESGALAAEVLGVDAVTIEGLDGVCVESLRGRALDDPALGWVLAIADQHRGETVLVLTGVGRASLAELSVDADGLVLRGGGL
jgi:hypothetical protein